MSRIALPVPPGHGLPALWTSPARAQGAQHVSHLVLEMEAPALLILEVRAPSSRGGSLPLLAQALAFAIVVILLFIRALVEAAHTGCAKQRGGAGV